jgi:hypothetical protein
MRDRVVLARIILVLVVCLVGAVCFFLWEGSPEPTSPPGETTWKQEPGCRPESDLSDTAPLSDSLDAASPDSLQRSFRGIVISRDGAPAGSGVVVEVLDSNGGFLEDTETRPDGTWDLSLTANELPEYFHLVARDPANADTSAPRACPNTRQNPCEFMLLRLRRSVRISGRVVDDVGGPVPRARIRVFMDYPVASGSPWASSEGEDRTVLRESDEEGSFSVCIRAGIEGRVAAEDAEGVIGPSACFRVPDTGSVNVGDVLFPGTGMARWTLRFWTSSRETVPNVWVKLGRDEGWEMKCHPLYSPGKLAILTGEDGVATLQFAIRETPVIIGVGSPRYLTRGVLLDCSRAGEYEADVIIHARPVARVWIRGALAKQLLDAGAELRIQPVDPVSEPPLEKTALNVRTGETAPVPPRQNSGHPFVLLESLLKKFRTERIDGANAFEVRVRSPGRYVVSLRLGSKIADKIITLDDSPREVDLPLDDGAQLVVLDWRKVRTWFQRGGECAWQSTYAAWMPSLQVGTRRNEAGEGAQSLSALEEFRWGYGKEGADESTLWLPPEVESVAFGFVERALGGGASVVHYVERVSTRGLGSSCRIDAPFPSDSPTDIARVSFIVMRSGKRLEEAGIPVNIYRSLGDTPARGSPAGSAQALTDESGTATVRLFPGRYKAAISRFVGKRLAGSDGWIHFEVSSGAENLTFDLELEYAR